MRPEESKYILDNIGKKPVRDIARELNIEERKIRKFIEREGARKPSQTPPAEATGRAPINRYFVIASLIILIILSFAAYYRALGGEFVWDDHILVKENLYVRDHSYWRNVFHEDIGGGAGVNYHYFAYRPIQILSYMFDYNFTKLNPFGYHLTNVLLHTASGLCVFWLVTLLFGDLFLSFITAALFAVHPANVAAVAYISGRGDTLATFFLLLSVIFYIKELHARNIGFLLGLVIIYPLAVLSRENTLILPLLLVMYHLVMKEKFKPAPLVAVTGVVVFYAFYRATSLKFLLPHLATTTTFIERLPGIFVAFYQYLIILFVPLDLHMEYGNKTFAFTDPGAVIGFVLLASIIALLVWKKGVDRKVLFGALWFFVMLLPVSNIYPVNAFMAEHWLYLPSIGFFLVLAYLFKSLYKINNVLRVIAIFIAVALVAFYLPITIRQNKYWKSHVEFYKETIRTSPESPKMYNNLAKLYNDMGKYDEAIPLLKKAIGLKRDYTDAYNNLGNSLRYTNKKEDAIRMYKKAIEFDPTYVKGYNNLGVSYADLNKLEDAIFYFKKAVEIDPRYEGAYANLGTLYAGIGKFNESISAFRKALGFSPDSSELHSRLAAAYISAGKRGEAIKEFMKAIELDPSNGLAYNDLSAAYYNEGKYDLAIKYCDKARSIGYKVNENLLKTLESHRK